MSKKSHSRRALIVMIAATVCSAAAQAQRPDFTGLWESYRGAPGERPSGFGGARPSLPLTEEGQRRVAEYQKLAGPTRLNGATFCADYGVPTMMSLPGSYPIEFIQKGDQLTIIFEVNNETRRIYIGDRQLPAEQRLPSRAGYSQAIGKATCSSSRRPICWTARTREGIRTPSRSRSTSASRSKTRTARKS